MLLCNPPSNVSPICANGPLVQKHYNQFLGSYPNNCKQVSTSPSITSGNVDTNKARLIVDRNDLGLNLMPPTCF
ncbi:hypothetical protein CFOL_v3_23783 [Cephalotus follicularis]|uniref:Uncharacterized protein n=1 Tax=Cephalotus follicularis TaxID=3775 RepID=A0A1Q3CJP0_CEPFO|nr:hypothetical protein CFOL_v3_23783 [Cephalotus follicularis]